MRASVIRILCLSLLGGLLLAGTGPKALAGGNAGNKTAKIQYLLQDPTADEWRQLQRFSGTLTRQQFETRLKNVFDPTGSLKPFLEVTNDAVRVFNSPNKANRQLLAQIDFAPNEAQRRHNPRSFRTPEEFADANQTATRPLAGLRIVIEPADIGGAWGNMEDRSSVYPHLGVIQEGDLNLLVGKILRDQLLRLGADVFLVREDTEPVSGFTPDDLDPLLNDILERRRYLLPECYFSDVGHSTKITPYQQKIAKGTLLTKTLEVRSRAELARRHFQADLTIVLQHNATQRSTYGALTPLNRNIFFVHGAYMPREIQKDPDQRYRLMLKLLQNVTPTEVAVASSISDQFKQATHFPPVLYGNTPSTRIVDDNNLYIVARNIAFNREHDGPVVVTEPYFMNQTVTIRRLLAGDYHGTKKIGNKSYISIYREYANCVTQGILAAYKQNSE